ncbi:MAG TPA: NRDE family protein [Gammaproteobacteria bacterium]|nr:NRDE family protein [Gammaproteobacteria bacterium]
MCVIALAYRASARYPLIACANRDENHLRPTANAGWWLDEPDVLGGRDLEAGGSWLAVDRRGRLAAVTNVHVAGRPPGPGARSRGLLVSGFVGGPARAGEFVAALEPTAADYGPFNLVLYDGDQLYYAGNRAPSQRLPAGVHAFSNALPGAGWPKIVRAREGLSAVLEEPDPAEALFALLAEAAPPPSGFDARQAALFQHDPDWGTRCSTLVLVEAAGRLRFIERRFNPEGVWSGEDSYEFNITRR